MTRAEYFKNSVPCIRIFYYHGVKYQITWKLYVRRLIAFILATLIAGVLLLSFIEPNAGRRFTSPVQLLSMPVFFVINYFVIPVNVDDYIEEV